MSPKNGITNNIVNNFEQRKRFAHDVLLDICQNTSLLDFLGENYRWAIVGGAVRDCLLTRDTHTKIMFRPWPDVDVAVATDKFDADKRLSDIEDMEFSIKHNSFGGWKVSSEEIGELDIWKIKLHGHEVDENLSEQWLGYLDNVDFTVNATAFLWPECEIIIHPSWIKSLKTQEVRRLYPHPLKKHLQPIRGIALAVKIEKTTDRKFKIGKDIVNDLVRLITSKDENMLSESLKYLQHKISSGRWPYTILQRFLIESTRYDYGLVFAKLVKDIFNEDLSEYSRLKKLAGPNTEQGNLW